MTAWVPWPGLKSVGPAEVAAQLWFFLSLFWAALRGSFKTWSAQSIVKKVFHPIRHPCAKVVIFVPVPTSYRSCGRGQFYSRAVRLEKHSNDPVWARWPGHCIPFLWAHHRGTAAGVIGNRPPRPLSSHWSHHTCHPLFFFFKIPPPLSFSSSSPRFEELHLPIWNMSRCGRCSLPKQTPAEVAICWVVSSDPHELEKWICS